MPILTRLAVSGVFLLPLTAFAAPPSPDDLVIDEAVPWALRTDAPVGNTLVEEFYGLEFDESDWPEDIRQGDMVFGRESFAKDFLEAMDLPPPLPGMTQPETPGILVVEMGGATMSGYCGNGESANGALNCSPLIDGTNVNYPASGANSGTVLQEVRAYMADFGLSVAGNRPADYVPYTLAMVGGSATQFGYQGGTCGIANVACDGLKRNHVSLTFENCGLSIIPDVIAQETSHNWGLEHVNNSQDLLYPTANGGAKDYIDQCMGIVDNGGTIQCSYVHEFYCPAGGGMQQNSFAEMVGVFGPAYTDMGPPEIVSISPADGTNFAAGESFVVTATVSEDTNFVGVRWTWLEGAPAEIQNSEGTYTKCTNKVCDDDFSAFLDPNEAPYDFLNLNSPPAGTYKFRFEVMDAQGQSDMQEITVTVAGGGGSGGSDSDSGGTGSGGTDSGGTATAGTDSGGSDSGLTGLTGASDSDGGGGGKDGCACRTDDETPSWALAAPFMFLLVRRRD